MTVPAQQPNEPIVVQPPPDEDSTAQKIATVLLAAIAAGWTLDKLVGALVDIVRLPERAVRVALGLANHAHRARPIFAAFDIGRGKDDAPLRQIVRDVADRDIYYRAKYIENAARRVQRSLDEGKTMRDAQNAEVRYYEQHRAARDKRLKAAAQVAQATRLHGPLLGWYRNWMLDSDLDCIIADGNNFDPLKGTVIGFPGSVHAHCGCTAGPPHEDGVLVDEALTSWGTRPAARREPRAS